MTSGQVQNVMVRVIIIFQVVWVKL